MSRFPKAGSGLDDTTLRIVNNKIADVQVITRLYMELGKIALAGLEQQDTVQ